MKPEVARAIETLEVQRAAHEHQTGYIIRAVRQAAGLSQAAFGELVGGFTQTTVSGWERCGVDSIATLRAIRDALDLPGRVLGLADDADAETLRNEEARLMFEVDYAFERLAEFYARRKNRLTAVAA